MRKKHDIVNIIYKIATLVRTITDDDFKEMENIIQQQESYINPLKPATMKKQRELAEHNKKMLNCIKKLKELVSK